MTQQTPLSSLNNLKIAHLNIRASGQVLSKPQATILHFARKNTDIMCITEVKISKKNYNYYHHKDYNTYHNLPDNHPEQAPKEGLIILISKTLCYDPPTITHIHQGRATITRSSVNVRNCLQTTANPLTETNKAAQPLFTRYLGAKFKLNQTSPLGFVSL